MEKNNHPSIVGGGGGGTGGGTSSNSGGNDRGFNLNHLNKASHKISKPTRRPLINDANNLQSYQIPPPIPPLQQQQQIQPLVAVQQQQQHHHQPPVYNISKNDFRDVVQRLTGSPAHERCTVAPAPARPMVLQQPKPTSSRLQRIRPPPLAQISNRPPGVPQIGGGNHLQGNVINSSGLFPNQIGFGSSSSSGSGQVFLGGQRQPLSPLPPFPSVHSAAESPVSAYMRYLQSSISSTTTNTAPSPRWTNALPPPQPQLQPPAPPLHQQQNIPPQETPTTSYPQFPNFPTSPLPFGCLPSPNSQMGFQQLPISPTVPLPSPKWRNI